MVAFLRNFFIKNNFKIRTNKITENDEVTFLAGRLS